MPKLDIASLQALCAIADQGGVTRAAAVLALSQSAVSHKIKRLEESLGCALLERSAGASGFTREGEKLLAYGRRILALHDEALLGLARQALHGRIRLGMTEDAANAGLARILGRFTRLHPQVRVHTVTGQSLRLAERLEAAQLDLGVLQVFEHQVRSTDTLLARQALHWVKAPDLELDPAGPLPFLAFDDDCFYREWAMCADHAGLPRLETVLTCASTSAIVAAAASGLGVALVGERHVPPGMEVMGAPFPRPPAVATVLRSAARRRTPAAAALGASIVQELGQRPELAGAVASRRPRLAGIG